MQELPKMMATSEAVLTYFLLPLLTSTCWTEVLQMPLCCRDFISHKGKRIRFGVIHNRKDWSWSNEGSQAVRPRALDKLKSSTLWSLSLCRWHNSVKCYLCSASYWLCVISHSGPVCSPLSRYAASPILILGQGMFPQPFCLFFSPLGVLISAAIYKVENTTGLGLKGEVEALKINI